MNKDRKIVKNGFVFIETIIAIIILIVSFLTLFNMYNKIYRKLDNRYEYDNITFIYKAGNVKKALENYSNFKSVYDSLVTDDKMITNIGIESKSITFSNWESYMKVLDTLKVSNVFLIKDINTYKDKCLYDYNQSICNYLSFNNNMSDYLNSINEKNLDYILLIEMRLNENGENCYDECTPLKKNGENCYDECTPLYTYLALDYKKIG